MAEVVITPEPQVAEAFEKKLTVQDNILLEAANGQELDEDIYDEFGNLDELGAKIKSTYSYRFKQTNLSCAALDNNAMFQKLK